LDREQYIFIVKCWFELIDWQFSEKWCWRKSKNNFDQYAFARTYGLLETYVCERLVCNVTMFKCF